MKKTRTISLPDYTLPNLFVILAGMKCIPAFFWQIRLDRRDLAKTVKTLSYRILYAMCFLLLCCLPGLAQDKHRITGTVISFANGSPIASASIFITGTSKGTSSNQAGNFVLNELPHTGSYELVISSIGYATQVFPFTGDSLPLSLIVKMKPKVTELASVTVEPYEKDGWERWGRTFMESFVGTSAAARQCTIKNYKTLRFRYSKKTNTLIAVADEPLLIENKALGYRIKYQLEDFIYNMKERSLLFVGYTLFEDLSEDKNRVPRRWIVNRKHAYEGSIMHFIRSLCTNQLTNDGFEVRRMFKEPNLEKDRVKKVYAALWRRSSGTGSRIVMNSGDSLTVVGDSTSYYRQILSQPDFVDIVIPHLLTADSVITRNSDSSAVLYFPNYLDVTYFKGKEEDEYLEHFRETRRPGFQRSNVFLLQGNAVVIEASGAYFPPQEFFSSGYWAWSEKMAHLLPMDYDPKRLQ